MADGTQSLTSYSDAEWSALTERAKWISKISNAPRRERSLIVRLAMKELGLCRSSIYNLIAKYDGDTTTSLAKGLPGKPRGVLHLPSEVEQIIKEQIEGLYLKRGMKVRVAEVVRAVARDCLEGGHSPPARSTIDRRIKRYNARDVARKRGELRKADSLDIFPGSREVLLPNEEWQIDHSPSDVLLVSAMGDMLGRAWVTFIIDVATRMIAAALATLDPPQPSTVARALSFAVLPKEDYLAKIGVSGPWPIRGRPLFLNTDNGGDFARSSAYRRGCDQHLIDFGTRREDCPRDGGHVERAINTMVGKMRLLRGATLSGIHEREALNPAKSACLQLSEFSVWLIDQVQTYNNTIHKSLGCTPLEAWIRKSEAYEFTPRMPPNPKQFFIDFLPFKRRTIGRQGVPLHTFEYYGDLLKILKSRAQLEIDIWYDPHDLSAVYARNESGGYDTLPIRYSGVPAFALWEVDVERRRRSRLGLPPISGLPLIEAILDTRGEVRVCGTTMRQHRYKERLREHGLTASSIATSSGPWSSILAGGLDV
jgi:putative transposase